MNKFNFIKKIAVAFTGVAMAAGVLFSAGVVHAIPYDGDNTVPATTPTFNVFTGVPNVGDESDFFRSRVPVGTTDTTTAYVDPLSATCVAGQKIQMRVYVHNGTSVSTNENGTGSGVAHGTKVKVTLPTNAAASFTPSATISATNVPTVNDNATINCNGKTVKLKYVAGSASQYSKATGPVALSDSIVTDGVPISSHGVSGDVWACWDERVYVILKVEIEEVTLPNPAYTCDLVSVTKLSDNKFRFTASYTVKDGAVFKDVTYNFGDGTTVTTGVTSEHSFNATSNVVATVNFTVDGQTKTNTNDKCAVKVTPTPATLVKTGPGSTLAIFAATSFIGAMFYRFNLARRIR